MVNDGVTMGGRFLNLDSIGGIFFRYVEDSTDDFIVVIIKYDIIGSIGSLVVYHMRSGMKYCAFIWTVEVLKPFLLGMLEGPATFSVTYASFIASNIGTLWMVSA